MFWENGKALAVFQSRRIGVYDTKGNLLGSEILFQDRVRLARTQGNLLAVAGWAGEICLIQDDGGFFSYSFANHGTGFHIPGALAFHDGDVYVGLWNGTIYRLTPGSTPEQVATHEAGIQLVQWTPDGLAVCDLEGRFLIMRENKALWTRPLEASLLLMQAFSDCLVAVGEKKLYHFGYRNKVFSEETHRSGAAAAWTGSDYLLVIDGQGRAVRYSPDLIMQANFQVIPGARPRSADHHGKYYVIHHPKSGWHLIANQQMVGAGLRTPITLALQDDLAAVQNSEGIQIMNLAELQKLLVQPNDHE